AGGPLHDRELALRSDCRARAGRREDDAEAVIPRAVHDLRLELDPLEAVHEADDRAGLDPAGRRQLELADDRAAAQHACASLDAALVAPPDGRARGRAEGVEVADIRLVLEAKEAAKLGAPVEVDHPKRPVRSGLDSVPVARDPRAFRTFQ